jgi:YegS/Rv2252/BmrU family lipid kinase
LVTIRNLLVVVNPRGGVRRGAAVLEQVRPVFEAAGVSLDVRVTERAGHAREIAQHSDLAAYDGVVVIGGDGTIHEAADGLMRRGAANLPPLGIVPAGSGNTLAAHLGCDDPQEAARRIVLGRTQDLDVVRVEANGETIFCIDLVGWGVVADVNNTSERLRFLGPVRYNVASLWHILRAKHRRARLTLDDRVIEDEFLFVLGCNAKYVGKGMQLAPHAGLDDGKLDVVVVRRVNRRQMFRMFSKVFDGSHLSLDYVEYHQVRSFAVDDGEHTELDLDGETKGRTPLSAVVMPGVLRMFV